MSFYQSKGLKSLKDSRAGDFPKLEIINIKLPPKVDYSYLYPAVDDQGPFGTCVAFSTKKVFEFYYHKRHNVQILISAVGIYSSAKSEFYPTDKSDDGLQVSDGLNILKQFYVLEKDLPYETSNFETCLRPVPDDIKKHDFAITDFVSVNPGLPDMKYALHNHGVLAIGIDFQGEWMNPGPTGRLQGSETTSDGGHCMSIVGYDDNFVNLDNSKGAFHLINNWTAQWGDKGYAWLPYNSQTYPMDVFTIKA